MAAKLNSFFGFSRISLPQKSRVAPVVMMSSTKSQFLGSESFKSKQKAFSSIFLRSPKNFLQAAWYFEFEQAHFQ